MASKQLDQETYAAQVKLAKTLNDDKADPCTCDELEEHPEGHKRGGYVRINYQTQTIRAYYDSTANEWFPYDYKEPT